MKWYSMDDMRGDLQLTSQVEDIAGIKKELKDSMTTFHPDKTGGQFINGDEKDKFLKYKLAYDYVEEIEFKSSQLALKSEIGQVVEILQKSISTQTELSKKNDFRIERRREIKDSLLPMRITSGAIGAFFIFLLTFSKEFKDDPFIGSFLKFEYYNLVLIYLLLGSGSMFLLTWFTERKSEQSLDFLTSENGKLCLFKMCLQNSPNIISKSIIKQNLFKITRGNSDSLPFRVGVRIRLSEKSIEDMADMAISYYLNKSYISKIQKLTLVEEFSVDPSIANEVLNSPEIY